MNDRIEIYRSGLARRWRWRYVAANGNIMADSGQGYTNKMDALHGALTVTGTERKEGRGYAVGDGDPRRLEIREVNR